MALAFRECILSFLSDLFAASMRQNTNSATECCATEFSFVKLNLSPRTTAWTLFVCSIALTTLQQTRLPVGIRRKCWRVVANIVTWNCHFNSCLCVLSLSLYNHHHRRWRCSSQPDQIVAKYATTTDTHTNNIFMNARLLASGRNSLPSASSSLSLLPMSSSSSYLCRLHRHYKFKAD